MQLTQFAELLKDTDRVRPPFSQLLIPKKSQKKNILLHTQKKALGNNNIG